MGTDNTQQDSSIMKIRSLSVISGLVAGGIVLASVTQSQGSGPVEKTRGSLSAGTRIIASDIPLEKYQSIVSHFNDPKNKVSIQFPGEESQYAWQNMSLWFPTAQVERGGSIFDLPSRPDDSIGSIKYRNSEGESRSVEEHLQKFPVDALIVVKNGNVVFERYQTMRPDNKHIWFSVSKVIGSTLMLFLEEEGKVDVNKSVTEYLPELKGSVWDTVKVIEALDMATGLNGTELDEPSNDAMVKSDQIWFQWAVSVGMAPRTSADTAKWYEVLAKMKRIRPAYDAFAYNSINTFVVDRIVERAGNKPLSAQLSERIWKKMGMEHDGYMVVSPEGYCLGNGFMNSTLRDLARFGLIFTPSQTKACKEKILTAQMLEKIQNTEHSEMYSQGSVGKFYQKVFSDQKVIANRYQWDAVFEDGDLFKAGIGGQGLYVSPSKDMVVAWFCTGSGANEEEAMARAIVGSVK